MKVVATLVVRNLRIFFRDRMGVFLSLLSALILLLLYTLFLGSQQVSSLNDSFGKGAEVSVDGFVNSWVFAGILMTTTVTTGLAAMNIFVEDRYAGRFKEFLVSPVSKLQLAAGYLLAAFTVAVVMSLIVFGVGLAIFAATGQAMLSIVEIFQTLGYLLLLCLTFSAMAAFGASFIKSSGGFTSLSTIVGTGIGFLAGSFVPVGVLPDSVANVINALPFSQAAMLMRQPLVADQLSKLAEVNAPAAKEVGLVYGMSINVGDWVPTSLQVIMILLGVFLVFAGLSSLRIRSRIG